MSQENANWNALCAMTDELFNAGKGQYASRLDAFNAACQTRPDLAADAVDPTGQPVMAQESAGATAKPEVSQTFEQQMEAALNSPLVKAAEDAAAAHARSGR